MRNLPRPVPGPIHLALGAWPDWLIGAPAVPDFNLADFHPFTPEQIAAGLVIPVFLPIERSGS